jgi:hypothetical protein
MLETSPIEACKAKIKVAKMKLATFGYTMVTQIIVQNYPQYDTAEGGELIKSVWQLRKADYKLTEILELIASGKLKFKKVKSLK